MFWKKFYLLLDVLQIRNVILKSVVLYDYTVTNRDNNYQINVTIENVIQVLNLLIINIKITVNNSYEYYIYTV